MKIRLVVGALVMTGLLSGCSSMLTSTGAPIVDRSQYVGVTDNSQSAPAQSYPIAQARSGATHTVQPGETLYSIATRNGCSPVDLARLNGISDPTQLRIGMVLRLTEQRTEPVNQPYQPQGQSVSIDQPVTTTETVTTEQPDQAQAFSGGPKLLGETKLQWPCARNEIWMNFGQDGFKGIEIAGQLGDPVLAAADGRVLYTSDNVAGYGQLIIMTHGNGAVTVYGHNSEILVKRGDDVKLGQTIAKVGSTESKRPSLLFEVRYNDKPVDPLEYLPQ